MTATYPPVQPPRKNHNKMAITIVSGLATLALATLAIVGCSAIAHQSTSVVPAQPTTTSQTSYDMGYQNGATGYAARQIAEGVGVAQSCQNASVAIHMFEDNPGLRGLNGPIPTDRDDWFRGCEAAGGSQ